MIMVDAVIFFLVKTLHFQLTFWTILQKKTKTVILMTSYCQIRKWITRNIVSDKLDKEFVELKRKSEDVPSFSAKNICIALSPVGLLTTQPL